MEAGQKPNVLILHDGAKCSKLCCENIINEYRNDALFVEHNIANLGDVNERAVVQFQAQKCILIIAFLSSVRLAENEEVCANILTVLKENRNKVVLFVDDKLGNSKNVTPTFKQLKEKKTLSYRFKCPLRLLDGNSKQQKEKLEKFVSNAMQKVMQQVAGSESRPEPWKPRCESLKDEVISIQGARQFSQSESSRLEMEAEKKPNVLILHDGAKCSKQFCEKTKNECGENVQFLENNVCNFGDPNERAVAQYRAQTCTIIFLVLSSVRLAENEEMCANILTVLKENRNKVALFVDDKLGNSKNVTPTFKQLKEKKTLSYRFKCPLRLLDGNSKQQKEKLENSVPNAMQKVMPRPVGLIS